MNKETLETYFNLQNFVYSGMLDSTHKHNAFDSMRELKASHPELKQVSSAFFDWEIRGADYPEISDFLHLVA